jgi:hypothetical protein
MVHEDDGLRGAHMGEYETINPVRVRRNDSVPAGKVEYTEEGYLIDTPVVTSTGIFEYKNLDGTIKNELRLPEHVFAGDSLASYEGKPVIITHEAGRVNAGNVADEIVGTILSKGYRDGDDVRAKIVIHDVGTVKQSGLRELSLGYDLTLDETPGEWNGQHYDAIQTGIVINHLAIVREARAGEQARLNIDGKNEPENLSGGIETMAKGIKRTNADDGTNPAATPEQPPQETGGTTESTVEETVTAINERHRDDEDISTLIGLIGQLQAEVEKLQAAKDFTEAPPAEDEQEEEPETPADTEPSMNADSVDAIVAERLELARIGDKLRLDGLERLKAIDAKKKIILAVKPNLKLDGKSEVYVDAAFDMAMNEYNARKDTEYQRQQIFNSDSKKQTASGANEARRKMIDKMLYGGNE